MPTVTALRPERRDRVRVELDGERWRTLPAAAVVSAGLAPGVELDRIRARELRRALRRVEALDRAAAALTRRDRSAAALDAILERGGVAAPERAGALETMARLGYLDDARYAGRRAAALAARGLGDEPIRLDLAAHGVADAQVEAALAALPAEAERARRVAGGLAPLGAARRLAARGFAPESIEGVVGVLEP